MKSDFKQEAMKPGGSRVTKGGKREELQDVLLGRQESRRQLRSHSGDWERGKNPDDQPLLAEVGVSRVLKACEK
jgi:hypothetical protein